MKRIVSQETRNKISKANKGKKKPPRSAEHCEKIRIAKTGLISPLRGRKRPDMAGDKNPNWSGGKSKKYKRGYYSHEYAAWRWSVFERDNYTCQECGFHGSKGYITAHHIKSFAKFPELRFEINNGLTLCEECHSKTDNYKGRAMKTNKTNTIARNK